MRTTRTLACLFLGSILFASASTAAGQKTDKTKANQPQRENETMSADMRRAIEFQRAKDRADARQAAIEAKHPTVFYDGAARSADKEETAPNNVVDPGPPVKK